MVQSSFSNTQTWQFWHLCKLCIVIYFQFFSTFAPIDFSNKKVLLHERKRHTARCVASTRCAGRYIPRMGWGWGVPTSTKKYLPWPGATYPSWSYLPVMGCKQFRWGEPTLAKWIPALDDCGRGVPTLDGEYLPWTGGTYSSLKVGIPLSTGR